jgi:hypothetical protein
VVWVIALLQKLDILEALERWFDPSDPELLTQRYDEAINALDSPNPEHWIALAGKAGMQERTAAHFREHWLGDTDSAYWSSITGDAAAEKVRNGFADAMRTAREQGLPLSYVWVTPKGLSKDYFEISHVAGVHAVTAVIVTPTPETVSSAE